ncbi:hypothetical protein QUB70_09135 [Microcoleus sp. A003_D6]|uniref:hypothetical protein n=1 Tax=Microcoleus sp. A003_D6 TaxID=3055266 RepID=UPI002FD232B0
MGFWIKKKPAPGFIPTRRRLMGTIPNLKSDDNSSIVPVSVREMSDNFENAVVRGDLGEKRVIVGCEGFFRLAVALMDEKRFCN